MHRPFETNVLRATVLLTVTSLVSGCALDFRRTPISTNSSGANLPTCAQLGSGTAYNSLGAGTADNPYLICVAQQLLDLMNPANSTAWKYQYRLGANLDLSGYNEASSPATSPIGSASVPFSGVFDGAGHSISNLAYVNAVQDDVGLFGVVSGSASLVKNLTVANAAISGHMYVGGLVGSVAMGATIANCATSGTVHAAAEQAGGLVGKAQTGAVLSTSSSAATVTAADFRTGGFVGEIDDALVFNSFAAGDVALTSGAGQIVGGFMGYSNGGATIYNSYATGSVTGGSNVGGFAGMSPAHCYNCFATGAVSASATPAGRLVGTAPGAGVFVNSYSYSGSPCTVTASACHAAVAGETQYALLGNFYNSGVAPLSSWNFSSVWQAGASYPTLAPAFIDYAAWGTCASHLSASPFAGGNGTVESPYLICSPAQLDALAANTSYWNSGTVFRLMSNLDMNGVSTSNFPIGSLATPFNGVFDGNGKTVLNFALSGNAQSYKGLFGDVAGVIKRLGVVNANILFSGVSNSIGGLAGQTEGGSAVLDSYVTGAISGWDTVAGLIGASYGVVARAYTTATVTGQVSGGGLIYLSSGLVQDSFSSNPISVGGGGQAISSVFGALTNVYYDSSQICTGCTVFNGTANASISYFYNPANLPLVNWDFNNVWQNNAPTGFPILR